MKEFTKNEVYIEANRIISSYLRLDEDELKPNTHIVDDAGADSLALVELGFQLSEKFGVTISDTSDEKLIFQNLVDYIIENINNTE